MVIKNIWILSLKLKFVLCIYNLKYNLNCFYNTNQIKYYNVIKMIKIGRDKEAILVAELSGASPWPTYVSLI